MRQAKRQLVLVTRQASHQAEHHLAEERRRRSKRPERLQPSADHTEPPSGRRRLLRVRGRASQQQRAVRQRRRIPACAR